MPFAGWASIPTYADLTGSVCWVLPLAAWYSTADLGLCPWFGAGIAMLPRHYPTHNLQTYGIGS